MRVTTDFWVSALVRRVFSEGGFAAVVRRGATEAGAVFVLTRDRFGETGLYAPAPQTSYDAARPDERMFTQVDGVADEAAAEARLARETRFDPDVWVVEIEAGATPLEGLIAVAKP